MEPDGVEQRAAGVFEFQFQVAAAHQALVAHREAVEEERGLEALAPDLGFQFGHRERTEGAGVGQRAVVAQLALQRLRTRVGFEFTDAKRRAENQRDLTSKIRAFFQLD